MDTDPTRHSKPSDDPRTIDLSAEEVRDIAPGEAEGTDEDVSASSAAEPVDEPVNAASSRDARNAPSSTPTVRPTAGSLPMIAAAIIGGVITLGGAAGLQYWGVLPSIAAENRNAESLKLLSSEMEGLKTSVANVENAKPPAVDLSPVNDKIAEIEQKMTSLPAANGLSADADTRLSALGSDIAAIRTSLEETKKAQDEAKAALLIRIEALEKKSNEPRDDVQVAVAIASAGLKAAIDRGGPFGPELQSLETINPDDPAVKELKTFAATGVPARAKLVSDFTGVADIMLAEVAGQQPNQSFTDRLWASAESMIKVRPVGYVEGEGADAIVARIEANLADGNLKGAAAEWAKLPDAAKKAGADFKTSLDARIKVEDLVGSTLSKAISTTAPKG
jgi:hypothetical protein